MAVRVTKEGAVPREYSEVQAYGDMTRDIGVAVVNMKTDKPKQAHEWHGWDTKEPTVSTIAMPGGFRRLHMDTKGVDEKKEKSTSVSPESLSPKVPEPKALKRMSTSQMPGGAGTNALPAANAEIATRYAETSFMEQLLLIHNVIDFDEEVEVDSPLLGLHATLLPLHARPTKGEDRPLFLILMICKPFVGTSILFLPRVFANGGILLAIGSLVFIGLINIYAMRLLVESADAIMQQNGVSKVPNLGRVCGHAFGATGEIVANVSLLLMQTAFCSCYMIFIPQTLNNFTMIVSNCEGIISILTFTIAMIIFEIPFALVRRMRYFAITNLLGNLFVGTGLGMVLIFIGANLAVGKLPATPPAFAKLDTYALALGVILVLFEGIGTILPMYDNTAMVLRPRFKPLLTYSMCGLVVFWIIFGTIGYLALTDGAHTIVLLDLTKSVIPGGDWAALGIEVMYCVAIFFSYPLLLYPVSNVVEHYVPGSGKTSVKVKMLKNLLRVLLVLCTAVLAYACTDQFDNFVALIGGVVGVPTAVIIPGLTNLKLVGRDKALVLFAVFVGVACAIFSTYQSIVLWGSVSEPPAICDNA